MAIQERLVIDDSGLRRDLKRAEGEIKASAERQARDVAGAHAKSARQMVDDYESAAKEAGRRSAKEIVKELRRVRDERIAQAKEAFARGDIDRDELRKWNEDARRAYNRGILKAQDDMRKSTAANREEYLRLSMALQQVGPAARRGLGEAQTQGNALQRTLQSLVHSTRAWIAGFLGFQALRMGARALRGMTDETVRYDAALTDSLAIMDDVTLSMRREMDQRARHVARRLNQDAVDVARGYRFLAAAGLDAEKSLASIAQVSTFATAGKFDLARATDLLTDAQSALGLASQDTAENLQNMQRVSDVLVKANTIANASVEQFSESLTNRAAAGLRMVNKDIEEGVAVLAAMADQGTKGAEAGTRLDIVLRDLQRTAIHNREEFERYGVAVFDSTGTMRNMADIVADLERALDGLSDEQRRATIMAMGFQDRSVAALLQLVGMSEAIRGYEADLRAAAGTTQRVADRQLASIENRWGRVSQKVAEVRRRFSETIVLPVAEWVMGVADALIQLDDPLERSIEQLQHFGEAAEAVAVAQLIARVRALREEAEEIERSLQDAHLVVATGAVRSGKPLLPGIPTVSLGEMDAAEVDRYLTETARELADAELRLAEAKEARNEIDEAWAKSEVARLRKTLDSVTEYRQAQERLREVTEQLRATESARDATRERHAMREQLRATRERLEAHRVAGTVGPLVDHLEAEVERLEQALARASEPAGDPPSPGPSEEQVKAAKAAAESLGQAMQEYTLAGEMGLRNLASASGEIRGSLQELLSVQQQIAEVEAQIAAIRAAGLEVPAGAEAYLAHLYELQQIARDVAAELIDRWQRDLPAVVVEMQNSFGRLPDLMIQTEAGVRSVTDAMRDLRGHAEAVAEAERELTRAQIARDPERAARAERRLADAQEAMRRAASQMLPALEAAGVSQDRLNELIERMVELLDEAGVRVEALGRDWAETARTFEAAARGVLSIADAMGVLNSQQRRVIQGAIDIAGGIATGGLGGGIQAVGGLVSLLSAITGDGAARREEHIRQIDEMIKLRHALEQLRQAVLRDVTAGERETMVERSQRIVDAARDAWIFARQTGQTHTSALAQMTGMSEEEVVEAVRWMEERSGRSLMDDQGVVNWPALLEVLESLPELGLWGDTLEGQLDALDWTLRMLGDDALTAAERIERFLEVLRSAGAESFADEYQRILDEQGPEAAEAWLDTLVEAMAANDPSLYADGGIFDGLTPEQARRVVERAYGHLTGPGGLVTGTPETRMAVNITQAQGSELLRIGSTQLYHLAGIHGILASMASLPAPSFGVPDVTPPALPSGGGTTTIDVGGITVEVELGSLSDSLAAREAGAQIGAGLGDAFVERIRSAQRGAGASGSARVRVEVR